MRLLDTTFLVDYERGDDAVAAYLDANEDATLCTSTLCIKEIAVGKHVVGDATESDILAPYGWLEILPFDASHAVVAGEMEAVLRRDDSVNEDRINAVTGDLLIAAVARSVGATVVTANVHDFATLGVPVESY